MHYLAALGDDFDAQAPPLRVEKEDVDRFLAAPAGRYEPLAALERGEFPPRLVVEGDSEADSRLVFFYMRRLIALRGRDDRRTLVLQGAIPYPADWFHALLCRYFSAPAKLCWLQLHMHEDVFFLDVFPRDCGSVVLIVEGGEPIWAYPLEAEKLEVQLADCRVVADDLALFCSKAGALKVKVERSRLHAFDPIGSFFAKLLRGDHLARDCTVNGQPWEDQQGGGREFRSPL